MTTPTDPRAEPPDTPPPQPKTTQLPAVTERALLEDLGRVVRNMADNVGTMSQNVAVLMEDRPVLHSRLAGVEGRLARIETPSHPPPSPLTSSRVQAIINETPSQLDLETQAQVANLIVQHAKEKAELEAKVVTKEDVDAVVSKATDLQTTALFNKISESKKLQVVAGMALTLLIGWLGRMATAPATPPQPAPVVQLAPVTVYADAGAHP